MVALACAIKLGLQPILFKNAAGHPLYCPYPLKVTIPAMVGVHLIIRLIESAITIGVYSYIKKVTPQTIYNSKDYVKDGPQNEHRWNKAISLLVLVALILCPFGLLASAPAWG